MSSLPLPSPLRRRWFFKIPQTDPVLVLSMLFSCLLVAARIFHTGRLTFVFLIWNLFLAYVPYWLSNQLVRWSPKVNKLVRITGLITWLLFIPNSFYILTDLYHLADGHRNARVPEWFDLALILSFAWNGLLLGVLSTWQVEKLLAPKASPRVARTAILCRLVFIYPLMFLNALGVYIGRDLRYNSWDILTNPIDLLGDMCTLLVHPLRHHYAWGMIFCFSVLLTFMYSSLTKNREPWKI